MQLDTVRKLKADILAGQLTQKQIGDKYGCSRSMISDISCGRKHPQVPWPLPAKKKIKASGRIGIVGDLHLPFAHPLYLQFVQDVFESWGIDHVHLIGDIVDAHALSFWDHNPNGMSAESEAVQALEELEAWKKAFPEATVSIGNHDARHYRLARKHGLPDRYLRSYAEVWDTPGWDWDLSHTFDGVLYEHGTGTSGKDAAFNRALQKRCSIAMGHVHSYAGVKYHSNEFDRIFGLNVGCGLDVQAYAFEYGVSFPVRPMLGCGIVIDGYYATFEPMQIGAGETYHRSRAA